MNKVTVLLLGIIGLWIILGIYNKYDFGGGSVGNASADGVSIPGRYGTFTTNQEKTINGRSQGLVKKPTVVKTSSRDGRSQGLR